MERELELEHFILPGLLFRFSQKHNNYGERGGRRGRERERWGERKREREKKKK